MVDILEIQSKIALFQEKSKVEMLENKEQS